MCERTRRACQALYARPRGIRCLACSFSLAPRAVPPPPCAPTLLVPPPISLSLSRVPQPRRRPPRLGQPPRAVLGRLRDVQVGPRAARPAQAQGAGAVPPGKFCATSLQKNVSSHAHKVRRAVFATLHVDLLIGIPPGVLPACAMFCPCLFSLAYSRRTSAPRSPPWRAKSGTLTRRMPAPSLRRALSASTAVFLVGGN